MTIEPPVYRVNEHVEVDEFIGLLNASGLGLRRPVHDRGCMSEMISQANLTVTARMEGRLVGVARSLTDFAYVAYLSDLAVDAAMQRHGIGRELVRVTRTQLGPRCSIVLLAAPAAVAYYPKLGFERHPQAWVLPPGAPLL